MKRAPTCGFTLIEILVTLALMSLLLALGLLLSMDVYRGTRFRSSRDVLVTALSVARSRALANLNQRPHGVCYLAPDFVLFEGSTYSPVSPANQLVPGTAATVLISSGDFFSCVTGSGIVFSQLSGTTSNTGVLTLRSDGHTDESVQVTSFGTILW